MITGLLSHVVLNLNPGCSTIIGVNLVDMAAYFNPDSDINLSRAERIQFLLDEINTQKHPKLSITKHKTGNYYILTKEECKSEIWELLDDKAGIKTA